MPMNESVIYPHIDTETCTRCGRCIVDCLPGAIDANTMQLDRERCIRCSHCSAICPVAAVSWNGDPGEALDSPDVDPARSLAHVIQRRRSVRHFRNQALPDSLVAEIIRVTNHAPTGTNSRGVGITVINSPEKMQEFSGLALRFFRRLARLLLNPITIPCMLPFIGLRGIRRLKGYRGFLYPDSIADNKLTHGAPALFVFHTDKSSSCPAEDGVIWATTAALYAESLGIGTCYNGFLVRGINLSRGLRRWLGVPAGHTVYETFLAGMPRYRYHRAAHRDPCLQRIIE